MEGERRRRVHQRRSRGKAQGDFSGATSRRGVAVHRAQRVRRREWEGDGRRRRRGFRRTANFRNRRRVRRAAGGHHGGRYGGEDRDFERARSHQLQRLGAHRCRNHVGWIRGSEVARLQRPSRVLPKISRTSARRARRRRLLVRQGCV